MDLFEYQGKQFFADHGIAISAGDIADTVDDAVAVADRLGYPVVVKAQVQVGGRGKAGGVKLASDTAEARRHATDILGLDIKGHVVKRLWIEKASDIAEEYYASFTLDRSAKKHLGMLSAEGGVEIETVAENDPDAIAKVWIDPVVGLDEATIRDWVAAAKLNPAATEGAVELLGKLYTAFVDGDADLCEVNPLILTPEGKVHALDSKVTLDDNAAFRHDWDAYIATQERDEREEAAHAKGSAVRGARRGGRGDRQRRRSGHVDRRHRQPGRWAPGELPRHRRRSERRGHGRGARGHQQRPQGAGHLHQHLRRDHQG